MMRREYEEYSQACFGKILYRLSALKKSVEVQGYELIAHAANEISVVCQEVFDIQ
jgi:hypothetical protein